MVRLRLAKLAYIASCAFVLGCMGGGWGGGFQMPPTPVEVTQPKMQAVEDRFETIGTISADQAVTVVAEIPGTVTRIPFAEGGTVRNGELLAKLDDRELQAALDRASAVRDQAQSSFNRVKPLVDQGAVPTQDLDDAEAALRVAEANVAFAQAQLEKTRISAPFGGMAGARRVSPGAYVQPGTPIVDIASVEKLRVSFAIPERYLNDLRVGSNVTIRTTAFAGEEVSGTVMAVEPQIDALTRNVGIVARIDNPELKYRPGMSANVAITLQERPAALTIASEAIFLDQNQPYVYTVKPDSTVARVALRLGSRSRQYVEIVSGLEAGQTVVRAGQQKIFDGAKVMPVSSLDSTAAQQQAAPSDSGSAQ